MLKRFEEVHVAVPTASGGDPVVNALAAKGILVHRLHVSRTGMNPFSDFVAFWSYFDVYRKVRPTMVLTYTAKAVIYGSIAARLCRVPRRFALVTGLGFVFQHHQGLTRRVMGRVVRGLYRLALSGVDGVIFQNRDDLLEMRDRKIISERTHTTVVRGSGVDCNLFRPAPYPERLCFLTIARLLRQKGVREFVKAAEIVKSRHPHVRFTVLGWRDQNPDAIDDGELAVWKRSGVVDFQDKVDDVRPIIEGCSVFVLPSYREGTPRTVLEAMAMARPIITTDAPGCRDTVVDGENGYLVEVGSVSGLVEAMERFTEDSGLVRDMGVQSRFLAERFYDVHKVNLRMLEAMGLATTGRVPSQDTVAI